MIAKHAAAVLFVATIASSGCTRLGWRAASADGAVGSDMGDSAPGEAWGGETMR
jgi:hypothetical protein